MKLIGEYPDHYMVQHFDGSSFPVAKKGISEEMHKKIKSFASQEPKNMASGGVVEESTDGGFFSPSQMTAMSQPSRLSPDQLMQMETEKNASETESSPWSTQPQSPSPVFESISAAPAVNAPVPSPMAGPVPQPAAQQPLPEQSMTNVSYGPNPAGSVETGIPKQPVQAASSDPYAGFPGYSETMKGINAQAAVTAQAGREAAKVYDNQIKQQEQTHQEYQGHMKAIDDKINSLTGDVMNGKIDPNRVWTNMDTGNKVIAGISILLGGIGSGLTGKSNAALDVINKSIDNDIEAQRADLGKKQNILGTYMQQYNNLEQAEAATKLHLASIAGAQIAKISAKSGGASANAAAQMAIGQWKTMQAPTIAKLAQSQMVGGSPLAQKIQILPENVRQAAWKELADYNSIQSNLGQIDGVMAEATKATTLKSNVFSPFQSRNLRETSVAKLFPIVKAIVGEKMTDGDVQNMVKPLASGLTDNEATIKVKVNALKSALMAQISGRTPILSEYGLVVDPSKIQFKSRGAK